jgi:hypothetical protein
VGMTADGRRSKRGETSDRAADLRVAIALFTYNLEMK